MSKVVKGFANEHVFGPKGPHLAFAGFMIQFSARASFRSSIDTCPVRSSRYDRQGGGRAQPAWCHSQARQVSQEVRVESGVFLQDAFTLMPHI